MKKPTVP